MHIANHLVLALAGTLLTLAPLQAGERVPARAIFIIDGDTVAIGRERVRLLDVDTPETYHSRCEAELVLGLAAKAELRALLSRAERVEIHRSGRTDVYGRTLARITVDDMDVGRRLVAEGLALPWRPGSAAKRERLKAWCG